ncbi:DUF4856 domain-containing protein [Adhaeribacter aquaticus]|uniref:DUF4856 domain-containing protein n=1 Tax=Adhaeribacter aquaticus TaxID=299567 RepID=UPI0003F4F6C2|nr:DUF4856 domain-containing protein [Adhaeribacter aquaticus]
MFNFTIIKNKNFVVLGLAALAGFSSCKEDDENQIPAYTVPASYAFSSPGINAGASQVQMAVELNSYLGSGTSTVLDQTKANNLFNNTNAPFTNAALNTSGFKLSAKTADVPVFQDFINKHVAYSSSKDIPATNGTAGFIPRGTGKILVGPQGLEYNQAVAKGMMGSLLFKEAMSIMKNIGNENNTTVTEGATAMQTKWDEAFGYLGIPVDYDSAKVYASTEVNRPLLWGGYLRERGRPIKAGGVLFEAFRKGRAAIGVKDYKVRDEQVKTIQDTWEKLAAISALSYVTIPQASSSVGNLGTQFHALSEGYGFVLALKYRAPGSKLTDANLQKLIDILSSNYYTLVNDPNFTKLKEAQTILKTTYNL